MEANVKAYERFLQFMEWLWCTLGYGGLLCVSIVVIEGGVRHSDWKYLHQRLLPATANFLSLSEKDLVIASADIPDQVAERKREGDQISASPHKSTHCPAPLTISSRNSLSLYTLSHLSCS